MEYNNLKFSMPYINCTPLKEKETLVIRNIIAGARLGEMVRFWNYGNISFDEEDKQHWNPIIKELDIFVRSKTNCMIFDIVSKNKYNKAILYCTLYPNDGFYGLLLYNTNTGKYSHICNINLLLTNMIITFYKMIKINELT